MSFSSVMSKIGLYIAKHGPTIATIAGTVLTVGGVVAACVATKKSEKIIEQHKEEVAVVHKCKDAIDSHELATEEVKDEAIRTYKKDVSKIYFKTCGKLVLTYAPAVLMVGAGLACFIGGHIVMVTRSNALMAAYSALATQFGQYRQAVIEEYGSGAEKVIRAKSVQTTITDENGIQHVHIDPNTLKGTYSKVFDEDSKFGDKMDYDSMFTFLRSTERYLNERLVRKGYVFLNEVYDALGIEYTKAGSVVGWILDPRDEVRENYISFGLEWDGFADPLFLNGERDHIVLQFNPDGVIYDRMND